VRERAPHRTRRANGRRLNIVYTLIGVIGLYVGWVLLTPEITAYEVGGILKVACNNYIRENAYRSDETTWHKQFLRRVRSAGVKGVNEDQYEFELSERCSLRKGCSCDAEMVFELVTPWPVLGDYVDAFQPRHTVHRKKIHVDYRVNY
jgi:hypothetical protein